jgi:hypothetical protein
MSSIMIDVPRTTSWSHPRDSAQIRTPILVEQETFFPAVAMSCSQGFVAAPAVALTPCTHAGVTVAEQGQHTRKCDHVDCFAARLLPEPSQYAVHACCQTHNGQLHWLRPDEHLDMYQLRSHIPPASIPSKFQDSSLQLQAPSRQLTYTRQLQSIPYPVGAATGSCVPHAQLPCSHSKAVHFFVHNSVYTSRRMASK